MGKWSIKGGQIKHYTHTHTHTHGYSLNVCVYRIMMMLDIIYVMYIMCVYIKYKLAAIPTCPSPRQRKVAAQPPL